MAKKKEDTAPCCVLTLPLYPEKWQIDIIEKRFRIMEQLKNALISKELSVWNALKNSKTWKDLQGELQKINTEIEKLKEQKNKGEEEIKKKNEERRQLFIKAKLLKKDVGLTEYGFINAMTPLQKHFVSHIAAQIAQKAASDVFQGFEKHMNDAECEVRFHKRGTLNSIACKEVGNGMNYRNNCFEWSGGRNKYSKKLIIPVKRDLNEYEREMLKKPMKYLRITRKWIKTRWKYYMQCTLEGTPPSKNRVLGTERVGIDIGTQTIAVVSEKTVFLRELADKVNQNHRKECSIQRKMDASKRSMNPDNFMPDGTIRKRKKGQPPMRWVKSKHYIRLQAQCHELERKNADIRKYQHYCLANEILAIGTDVFVEKMNFKGLQRRAKETKRDERGRAKKKKRFGKSLANKAPSSLLTILDGKLKALTGKNLQYVNTKTFAASQYDHTDQQYRKKQLSDRWAILANGDCVQRDLYSAFLLMNSDSELTHTDQSACERTFARFKLLHDCEIERIRQDRKRHLSSFGIG